MSSLLYSLQAISGSRMYSNEILLVLIKRFLDNMGDASVKLNYFAAVKNLLISKNYKVTLEKLDIFDISLEVSFY